MSSKIQVPENVIRDVKSLIEIMDFKHLMDMFLQGACRHTVLETDGKFELVAISIKCVGDKLFEFTFGITHECDDDRSWWVVDATVSTTRSYEK